MLLDNTGDKMQKRVINLLKTLKFTKLTNLQRRLLAGVRSKSTRDVELAAADLKFLENAHSHLNKGIERVKAIIRD